MCSIGKNGASNYKCAQFMPHFGGSHEVYEMLLLEEVCCLLQNIVCVCASCKVVAREETLESAVNKEGKDLRKRATRLLCSSAGLLEAASRRRRKGDSLLALRAPPI